MKIGTVLKLIISIIFASAMGSFVMALLGNIELNIWVSRSAGSLVAAIVGIAMYYLWVNNDEE